MDDNVMTICDLGVFGVFFHCKRRDIPASVFARRFLEIKLPKNSRLPPTPVAVIMAVSQSLQYNTAKPCHTCTQLYVCRSSIEMAARLSKVLFTNEVR